MLTFRIKVPGHGEYTGIFASAAAARISAQALYPAAQPASVFCLSRMGRAPGPPANCASWPPAPRPMQHGLRAGGAAKSLVSR